MDSLPSGHRYLDDEGNDLECGDEGRLCDVCLSKEAAYWASYFGIDKGPNSNFRHFGPPQSDEEHAAWGRFKDGTGPEPEGRES